LEVFMVRDRRYGELIASDAGCSGWYRHQDRGKYDVRILNCRTLVLLSLIEFWSVRWVRL
jgi:hypothetical protein